ncbi:COX15/CtaA family protein [Pararhizobium haloflavum]|uniref:COX15/CtaA family protein n=1 Tax=Pararhizobium haloflavum TaxID=2037914 RepID=UPI000C186FF0|nr:COX15/CtaA family protein [Pararhizobium haloflavum]
MSVIDTAPAASNAAHPADTLERRVKNRRLVRIWLGVVLLMIFALVIVGGATRLTESGLSITEWKPIHGVIPPLSEAEWQEELELYRQIPQYQEINRGMSLDQFKTIYWWEWAHRFLARGVGIAFALPLAFLWLTGRVEPRLRWPLVGLLALGGLQGFVGWWMVASGLTERIDVSQYRLATHLTLACLIFAAIFWVMRALAPHSGDHPPTARSHLAAGGLVVLIILQIYLGALVAGLNAGWAYNTWPLMDGAIIPGQLFVTDPAWLSVFESGKTAQFVHRMTAYALWIGALAHMVIALRRAPGTTHANRSIVLFALVTCQAAVGIATLLMHVPIGWALMHQGGAVVVLGFAIAHWRAFYGAYLLDDAKV